MNPGVQIPAGLFSFLIILAVCPLVELLGHVVMEYLICEGLSSCFAGWLVPFPTADKTVMMVLFFCIATNACYLLVLVIEMLCGTVPFWLCGLPHNCDEAGVDIVKEKRKRSPRTFLATLPR